MTERIVRQLGEIQRTHGELRAVIVHEPEESPWFPPPIESTKHAFFAMHSSGTGIIWTESSEYTNAMEDFARLCPELIDSTTHSSELQEWRIPAAEGVENLFQWLWFAAGFALAKLPGRTPRAFRKCWGRNGHFFNPDALEQQRQNLPPAIAANMPPNADNWLAKIENLIQVSIEAVEYFDSLSGTIQQYSKPLRFNSWFTRFKEANYSENESERAFRDWLADQISCGKAKRETKKGPICFELNFLATHGVKDSE
jgi:hypothetical protein